MVMDEMFSLALSDLPLGDTEQVFGFESDISPKSMDSIIPVDLAPLNLEELEFDFEDMEDFGPWIETNVTTDAVEPEPSKNQLSENDDSPFRFHSVINRWGPGHYPCSMRSLLAQLPARDAWQCDAIAVDILVWCAVV